VVKFPHAEDIFSIIETAICGEQQADPRTAETGPAG
jgi:hypothetical protein